MWIGWDQLPELLRMFQISGPPRLHAARTSFKSISWPLTVQPPLERSNFQFRTTAADNSAAVGRGSGLRCAGTWLGSGAFAAPWTMNFRTGTPGSMRL